MINSAQKAIALLINMAQQGEIDPWDVQVIEVIDRFLSELQLTSETTPDFADLPQSGQVFLWASMLVLLKADTLEKIQELEEEEEEYLPEEEETTSEANTSTLPAKLERQIRRRLGAPPIRKRKVTLQELIEQIEQIAAQLEKTPPRPRRTPSQSRKETTRAITELAHDENLTEVAGILNQFLNLHWSNISNGKDCVNLDQLLLMWKKVEGSDKNAGYTQTHDKVGIFWGLLLLCAQSKVDLYQSEFYQDLQIRPLSVNQIKSA